MPKSLSTFLDACRGEIPDEVVHISKPIDPAHYDATAIIKHLGAQKRFPIDDHAGSFDPVFQQCHPAARWPFSPVSKCPDEAMARIKLEEFVPGEILQHIPIDRTTYRA